jgi:hypothetical protein
MALTDQQPELPRFTRFVHAFSLAVLEGMSLGFAAATLAYGNRLAQFVMTNRMAAGLRKEMLMFVILPALILPFVVAGLCAMPKLAGKRLVSFERRVRLLAPLCAIGFVPLVFQPTLWSDKPLAFLIATALFSIVTVLSVDASLLTWSSLGSVVRTSDWRTMVNAMATRITPKMLSILVTGVIVAFALVGLRHSTAKVNLAATGIANEWVTVRHFSEVGGMATWFTIKGMRATGHASCLGAVHSVTAWFLPKLGGLVLLRLLAISLAAIPLFYWCKKSLGLFSAFLISIAFLSMPSVGMIGMRDSFPITFAIGCFFLAAYYFENGQVRRGLLTALFGIAINEQVAIWYSLLGLYLLMFGPRRRIGKWLTIFSTLYFLTMALVVLPHYGVKTYQIDLPSMPSIGAQNLGATLTTLVVNPAYALSRWFETQNLEYWLALFVPLAFLPFRGKRWFVWLLPVMFFAGTSTLQDSNSQWRDPIFGHFIALGFLATIACLRQVRTSAADGQIRYRAALVGWLAALLPCIGMFGSLYYRNS